MATIFDGKKFALEKEERLMGVVGDLRDLGRLPRLVAILAGDNPESELYLKLKQKAAERLGIEFEMKKFTGENLQDIIDFVEEKNKDRNVTGIMAELPLPKEISPMGQMRLIGQINPEKDVDCLTSTNLKLLDEGHPRFIPPTVRAVGEILKKAVYLRDLGNVGDLAAVVVGSKGTVGKGVLSYLRYLGNLSNLIGIDKETKDISLVTKEADVLISATGVGHLIKKEMVKFGAIVIDVGIEKQLDGSLLGDVDFENVKETASFITPVPGGIGPVTVISLMENLLQSVYH